MAESTLMREAIRAHQRSSEHGPRDGGVDADEGGNQSSSEVIRGHQSTALGMAESTLMREAIRAHQRSSEHGLRDGGVDADAGGNQSSSEVIRGHQSTAFGMAESTLIRVRQRNRASECNEGGHQWQSVAIKSHLLGFVNARSTRVASRT
jgi:hypothetical protein